MALVSGGTTHVYAALSSGVHALSAEEVERQLLALRRGETTPLLWIDIADPGEAEAEFLRERLGFHPLAVEDTVRGRQRPKLERYPGYFFLVVYAAGFNEERQRTALNELHIFLGERFVVTVHDHKIRALTEVVAGWRAAPERFPDSGTLAHALLDGVVDGYFPVLERFGDRVERVETQALAEGEPGTMERILGLRREMVLFRRVIVPTRDVLSTLLRRDLPFLRPELLPYFQDVHDHTLRVAEEIDTLRELLSASLEAQLTHASNQLNQTMRTMTAWAIILMSMALVAGVYGMNFAYMPELAWRYGYFGALAAMAALGTMLALYFRRRRWL